MTTQTNQKNLNDIFFQQKTTGVDYNELLEEVQKYLSDNHAKAISSGGNDASVLIKNIIKQYLIKQRYAVDGYTTEQVVDRLYEDMAGYSFLRKWIYMEGVEEVNINAYNDIEVIMSGGKSMKIPEKFASPTQAIDVMRRMLTSCGMVIDDTMPSVLGHIDKNIRISVDKTPLVDPDVGVNASIRIVNQQSVTEDKLLNSGSATREMLDFLTACVRYGVSVCIAGATGSGKTTIMAWLLSTVPDMTKQKKLRHLEYYDLQDVFDRLYADSQKGKIFRNLMEIISDENNIKLAYRNIKRNSGSNTPGVDKVNIRDIEMLDSEKYVEIIQRKLTWYKPKPVKRVEIPKPNGKTRPLGIPTMIDRLVQQCILQILEPICEAKFHERSNGFRPNRSAEHAMAQC